MPIRPKPGDFQNPAPVKDFAQVPGGPRTTGIDMTSIVDELESLRQGTREQYESEWTQINDGETHTFTHNLDETPWSVSTLFSTDGDGKLIKDSAGDVVYPALIAAGVTVTTTATTIKVANATGTNYYYKVRAL